MSFNHGLSFAKNLKKMRFDEAVSSSINIKDNFGTIIGRLIPVGSWIFEQPEIINLMIGWRARFNRMFPTQSIVSYQTTVDYINRSSIENDSSILFLLYDDDSRCVGHIGIAHIDKDPFELVNLMRGMGGGHPRLSYFSEVALLDYFFKNTNADSSNVEVMSFNWLAISLHEEIGYTLSETLPLKKIEGDFGVKHFISHQSDSNVHYFMQRYILKSVDFYERANFLLPFALKK